MTAADEALRIDGLSISLPRQGDRRLIDGVSLTVARHETVGLVGESGSGKSLTARAALGLFPPGARVTGSVEVAGAPVIGMPPSRLLELRRRDVAMIFQDPRASLNPVRPIGDFMTESLRARGVPRAEARRIAVRLLGEVGIHDADKALRRYPHEFSGGMLQRVTIAAAVAIDPALLLADEATTALDVTTQAEVVGVLESLQQRHRTGMLFVTHNLELAAAVCDRIVVMYAGRVVETADAATLFRRPAHPYTAALLRSSPSVDGPRERIAPIAGRPRSLADAPSGCAFRDRCPLAVAACAGETPALRRVGVSLTACVRAGELAEAS